MEFYFDSFKLPNNPNQLENANGKNDDQHLRNLQHFVPHNRSHISLKQTDDCIRYRTDCDEVYPSLFVGDAASALNKAFLLKIGITHILNAAEGKRCGQVDTGRVYYRDLPHIQYMGFPLVDHPNTNISPYFYVASKFIDKAITSGGKVLVHCQMGISRSATCAISYLMICREMTAADAICTVRLHRAIYPNDGFRKQLSDLCNELQREKRNASRYY